MFCFPPDLINISRYSPLFNAHLQVCVDRQILPVASDAVDFMLLKNMSVDHALLQILLHKLGKQNLWLRAREVFRRKYHLLVYCLLISDRNTMQEKASIFIGHKWQLHEHIFQ